MVRPSSAARLEARAGRVAMMRQFLAHVAQERLDTVCGAPAWDDADDAADMTVLRCLGVLFGEEWTTVSTPCKAWTRSNGGRPPEASARGEHGKYMDLPGVSHYRHRRTVPADRAEGPGVHQTSLPTGPPVSVETVAVGMMSAATVEAVASSYGLGVPVRDPVYAARGELGRIWRLDTESGSWAVKELLLPVDEAEANRDVEFQLAAEAAGIPLPRPWRTRDGRVVLPAEEAACPWSLRVYRWVDLVNWPAVSGAEVGALVARLHLVRHHDPGPVEAWFSEPLGEPAWEAMLSQARRENAQWAMPLDRWLPDLIALDAVVVPPDPARLTTCHRDLNTENVRRAADGGVVVLDWENSGPDQPERELATVVSDLAADAGLKVALAAYVAYQAAGGPARLTRAADFSTAAAVQGHLLQFYSRRALNPAESRQNRVRAESRLGHMLSQPLTIARIDYLMELLTQ